MSTAKKYPSLINQIYTAYENKFINPINPHSTRKTSSELVKDYLEQSLLVSEDFIYEQL